eukprot:c10030_g1_i1.p1 GENE.c10030_g1_i1~~c10030_g1_i1.p1  ORF type:complete len:236 (-),score=58.05 c10030_g1_i1:38-745(-)
MEVHLVRAMLLFLLICSFGYCIASFMTISQCYVEPCYKGEGLSLIFQIRGGPSLRLFILAFVTFAHVFYSFHTLFKVSYNDVKYGILIGFTVILCLIMLTQSVYWGEESTMMDNLSEHLAGQSFYEKTHSCSTYNNNSTLCESSKYHCTYFQSLCQRKMGLNYATQEKFTVLTWFSSFLFISYGAFSAMLIKWKDDFGEETTNINSNYPDSSDPAQVQYTGNNNEGLESYHDTNL